CSDKLINFNTVASIKRGITTGINEFFYLTADRIQHWGIEDEFLIPVFKSPKESTSIAIAHDKLKLKGFFCSWSRAELLKAKKNGALNYIAHGVKQRGKDGVLWSKRPSVVNRKPEWWVLPDVELASIFWSKAYDSRLLHRFSSTPVLADCRLYFVSEKKAINKKLLAAVLNSSVSLLFLEIIGRVNLGEGALDVMVEDAVNYMVLPDLNLFTDDIMTKLLVSFDKISQRPVRPIFEEVKMKDRRQLDSLILEAMGLDTNKYLKPLYKGLTEMVRERTELGKMRPKVKKAKYAKDVESLKNNVLKMVLPNGPKKFPEEFLEKALKAEDCKTVPVTGELLKLGTQFLTQQEVISDGGYKYNASSINEAKYIVYAQKPNSYLLYVPTDEETMGKAVQKYEIYLKELRKKISSELGNLVDDYKLVISLTQQIFAEFNLPFAD
ncbi:MAG: hypothetical protein Q8O43_01400, partial [Dehalococcoidia bacterium]|nr:hypothetical protein [Dehalococcoidia bacterium]